MRYAVVYQPGTVRVVAYVHMGEDGSIRLARPIVVHKGQTLTIDYPAPGVARRPFPEPEWAVPVGLGPEGVTYHA